ncbi:hypothetical protein BJ742DRAFT_853273 [Cladochytrium replicatum]|nr:hypothetical protein BJ742DRAFT_853273 [Cladochytrium replicatum]
MYEDPRFTVVRMPSGHFRLESDEPYVGVDSKYFGPGPMGSTSCRDGLRRDHIAAIYDHSTEFKAEGRMECAGRRQTFIKHRQEGRTTLPCRGGGMIWRGPSQTTGAGMAPLPPTSGHDGIGDTTETTGADVEQREKLFRLQEQWEFPPLVPSPPRSSSRTLSAPAAPQRYFLTLRDPCTASTDCAPPFFYSTDLALTCYYREEIEVTVPCRRPVKGKTRVTVFVDHHRSAFSETSASTSNESSTGGMAEQMTNLQLYVIPRSGRGGAEGA